MLCQRGLGFYGCFAPVMAAWRGSHEGGLIVVKVYFKRDTHSGAQQPALSNPSHRQSTDLQLL